MNKHTPEEVILKVNAEIERRKLRNQQKAQDEAAKYRVRCRRGHEDFREQQQLDREVNWL